MLGLLALAAAQAAAPSAAVSPVQAEAQARKVLASHGMSPAGIDASIAIEKRHQPALRAIVTRGAAAENAIRAALSRQPIDVDGFARATTLRADATGALAHEAAQVAIEQMRALSPPDRALIAKAAAAAPALPQPARR